MSDLRKAAEMALAALEPITSESIESALIAAKNARYFLRQALAQPEPKPTLFYGKAVYFADPQTGDIKTQPEINFGEKQFQHEIPSGCTRLSQPEQEDFALYTGAGESSKIKHSLEPIPEQEPLAWATFDGEGSYDFRSYEDNETYRDEYIKQNGNKYANWVKPLYTAPPKRCACHQIVWDYGFSRVDNEEVQAACVDLAQAIQARGKND